MALKSFFKDLLPPVLLRCLKKMRGAPESSRAIFWQGDYPDWESAAAASTGYDQKSIFIKVRDAARAVRDGDALWERDSSLFYQEEYNWPFIAALMSVAAWNKGRLRVLDFGGAFGSMYMQHRALLDKLEGLFWDIVEQPSFVACGRKEFCTEILRFWPSMEALTTVLPVDVILFSSVLQYLEEPYALLAQAVDLAPRAIIIDRTPFSEQGERITVQRVPPEIYLASYPCRWLDRERVESILRKNFILSPWWQSPVDPLGFQGIMGYRSAK